MICTAPSFYSVQSATPKVHGCSATLARKSHMSRGSLLRVAAAADEDDVDAASLNALNWESRSWQTVEGDTPKALFKWKICGPDQAWLMRFNGQTRTYTLTNIPQPVCEHCGMAFSLRDMVETAVEQKVHSSDQVAAWLSSGAFTGDAAPKRLMRCYKCGKEPTTPIVFN